MQNIIFIEISKNMFRYMFSMSLDRKDKDKDKDKDKEALFNVAYFLTDNISS